MSSLLTSLTLPGDKAQTKMYLQFVASKYDLSGLGVTF
jgi:hypothetical protein